MKTVQNITELQLSKRSIQTNIMNHNSAIRDLTIQSERTKTLVNDINVKLRNSINHVMLVEQRINQSVSRVQQNIMDLQNSSETNATAITNRITLLSNNIDLGEVNSTPASSCRALASLRPSLPSELYWVKASNGSPVQVYCDLTNTYKGIMGWMSVAQLNHDTNGRATCFSGLINNSTDSSMCVQNSEGPNCSHTFFTVNGTNYSSVYGRIEGYGVFSPDGFGVHGIRTDTTSINGKLC